MIGLAGLVVQRPIAEIIKHVQRIGSFSKIMLAFDHIFSAGCKMRFG